MDRKTTIEYMRKAIACHNEDRTACLGRNCCGDCPHDYPVNTIELIESALELLEQDRWIPVTERLPEIKHYIDDEHFSDDVLVTEWFNGFKKTRIGNFDTRTGWWNDEKGCGFLGVITSWRPLPAPYTEDEA